VDLVNRRNEIRGVYET